MQKKILIAGAGILALALIFVALGSNRRENAENLAKIDTFGYVEANAENGEIADHIIGGDIEGAKNGKKVVIEYADFSCPFCARMVSNMKELLKQRGKDFVVIFRNYVLRDHQNSMAAASAAEAAGLQGYWQPYYETLFVNSAVWVEASVEKRGEIFANLFKAVTKGKGDVEQFKKDIMSERVKKKIAFDEYAADKLKVSGTPYVFVRDRRINLDGIKTLQDFVDLFKNV